MQPFGFPALGWSVVMYSSQSEHHSAPAASTRATDRRSVVAPAAVIGMAPPPEPVCASAVGCATKSAVSVKMLLPPTEPLMVSPTVNAPLAEATNSVPAPSVPLHDPLVRNQPTTMAVFVLVSPVSVSPTTGATEPEVNAAATAVRFVNACTAFRTLKSPATSVGVV